MPSGRGLRKAVGESNLVCRPLQPDREPRLLRVPWPPLRAGKGEDMNGSQFYITLGENLYSLDEKHTIFGEVGEGLEVLEALNEVPCDNDGRPLQNIRCGRGAGGGGQQRLMQPRGLAEVGGVRGQ